MIFPEKLRKGDWVGIVAPSSPVDKNELNLCISSLKALGYLVEVGNALKNLSNVNGYLAGTALERARDINRMFENPDIKAIFCIRGGYGSAQIVEHLDYSIICKNPKIFIGYSDITNLHTVLQKCCDLVTFHGPMVKPNMMHGLDAFSWKSLFAAINMKEKLEFKNPHGEEFRMLSPGYASGIITGGNLSVLSRACGTFYQPNTYGKILYLEDIGESIPLLDMALTQLRNAGILGGLKGILLGDFTLSLEQKENSKYGKIEDFFHEWFRYYSFSIPIMAQVRSDHRIPMGTIPFGTMCTMNTYEGTISFSATTHSRAQQ